MQNAIDALRATAPLGTTISYGNSDPCKGWTLEVHGYDDDPDMTDAQMDAVTDYVERFKTLGLQHLGEPGKRDLRIRLQGESSYWTMFEFSSLDEAGRDAAITRFAQALSQA